MESIVVWWLISTAWLVIDYDSAFTLEPMVASAIAQGRPVAKWMPHGADFERWAKEVTAWYSETGEPTASRQRSDIPYQLRTLHWCPS